MPFTAKLIINNMPRPIVTPVISTPLKLTDKPLAPIAKINIKKALLSLDRPRVTMLFLFTRRLIKNFEEPCEKEITLIEVACKFDLCDLK